MTFLYRGCVAGAASAAIGFLSFKGLCPGDTADLAGGADSASLGGLLVIWVVHGDCTAMISRTVPFCV